MWPVGPESHLPLESGSELKGDVRSVPQPSYNPAVLQPHQNPPAPQPCQNPVKPRLTTGITHRCLTLNRQGVAPSPLPPRQPAAELAQDPSHGRKIFGSDRERRNAARSTYIKQPRDKKPHRVSEQHEHRQSGDIPTEPSRQGTLGSRPQRAHTTTIELDSECHRFQRGSPVERSLGAATYKTCPLAGCS